MKNKRTNFYHLVRKIQKKVVRWVAQNQGKVVLTMLLLIVLCISAAMQMAGKRTQSRQVLAQNEVSVTQAPEMTPAVTKKPEASETVVPVPAVDPTEGIYTYLQGPKSWSERRNWSGEWGQTYMDGGSFGGFGCGLCCMANIYSSLTKYQCSPADMYRYAKKKTFYGGGGAIDWGYMRQTLTSLGFQCRVKKKPSAYEDFQKAVAGSKSCLVLVSSSDSTCYWKDTPGHYVTIFLYDKKTDKVFLADSGDPDHNRHWVSLKKIYRSLKTSSNWQYLTIKNYDQSKDTWRHKKSNGNWVRPE